MFSVKRSKRRAFRNFSSCAPSIRLSSALPIPEACIGDSVPGGKKARMLSWVSTWLTNITSPPFSIPRFAVSPVASISARITGRLRSITLLRRRKDEPRRNAIGPICQACEVGSDSTMPRASMVLSTR